MNRGKCSVILCSRQILCRFYHKSRFDLEIENCTISDFMFRRFEQNARKTALIDGKTNRTWTFGRLLEESRNLSNNLASRGFEPGDVACLCGTNEPEFAHVLGGVTSARMALTIANSQLTTGELTQQVSETKSRLLFATEDCAEKAKHVKDQVSSVKDVIVIGEHSGCIPLASLLKNKPACKDRTSVDTDQHADDVALIPFSSGTTGVPKGVMLTHRNLVAQLTALRTMIPFYEDDRSLSVLPMVHIAGLVIGMLNPLCQGATVVTLPRFDPLKFLTALQNYRISFSLIAPPVVSFLANDDQVDKFDLSCFTNPYSGAAPLGRELTEKMVERLKITGIRQGYGMSEASPALTTTPLDGWTYGSIGVPLPNTECKVVDIDTGATLGANQNGEIWSRGPQVMKGYLNNPVATADTITDDGWLKTGDIGYFDNDGHYFIVDRLKEIIKYKGYQVAPAYLESILLTHPDVEDAAVVGVPHDVFGHLPRAYVVCRQAGIEQQITTFVNNQVAPYKKLRGGVHIIDKLPRSPSGKILRRHLLS